MKLDRRILVSFILTALGCTGAHAQSPTKQEVPPLSELAKQLIEMLSQGKYDELAGHFDETVKAALPESKLVAVWAQLTSSVGEFVGVEGVREFSEASSVRVSRRRHRQSCDKRFQPQNSSFSGRH